MRNILSDLSPTKLTSAIEDNLFALIDMMRAWPRVDAHDEPGILWSISDIPFPVFNSIMRARLEPEKIDPVIETITAQAKSRNVPLLWWTGPSTQPADLEKYLEKHGFFYAGHVPGMALDLGNLDENPSMPEGFTVQWVKDNETLKVWGQVSAQGFGMPDFAGEGFYDLMCHADLDTARAYLGWLDGEPVATALVSLAAGVAGVYNIATLPSARRKGIGARMTDLPLLEARALGYKASILHASGMGEGVYRSLGFQEYCKIGQYIWSPQ